MVKQKEVIEKKSGEKGDTILTKGEPLATLIKIPAVEFYLPRVRYWS